MNAWKVILATLVIYSAGLITGGLLVRQGRPFMPPPQRPPFTPREEPFASHPMLQERFLEQMRVRLDLTPEQFARLKTIFAESRERTRIITDLVRPEMQAEIQHVRKRIHDELTPEQRRRFEELMRNRRQRVDPPSGHPIPRDRIDSYQRGDPSNRPPGAERRP